MPQRSRCPAAGARRHAASPRPLAASPSSPPRLTVLTSLVAMHPPRQQADWLAGWLPGCFGWGRWSCARDGAALRRRVAEPVPWRGPGRRRRPALAPIPGCRVGAVAIGVSGALYVGVNLSSPLLPTATPHAGAAALHPPAARAPGGDGDRRWLILRSPSSPWRAGSRGQHRLPGCRQYVYIAPLLAASRAQDASPSVSNDAGATTRWNAPKAPRRVAPGR